MFSDERIEMLEDDLRSEGVSRDSRAFGSSFVNLAIDDL